MNTKLKERSGSSTISNTLNPKMLTDPLHPFHQRGKKTVAGKCAVEKEGTIEVVQSHIKSEPKETAGSAITSEEGMFVPDNTVLGESGQAVEDYQGDECYEEYENYEGQYYDSSRQYPNVSAEELNNKGILHSIISYKCYDAIYFLRCQFSDGMFGGWEWFYVSSL